MTVIKINAITVPEESGDELARRFAARAGAVDNQEGFEGFELLQPTDGRNQWLVVTRWRDDEAFNAWVSSPSFAHGHAGADRPSPPPNCGRSKSPAAPRARRTDPLIGERSEQVSARWTHRCRYRTRAYRTMTPVRWA